MTHFNLKICLSSEQQDAIVIALLAYLMKPISSRSQGRKRKCTDETNVNTSISGDTAPASARPSICTIQDSMVVLVPVSIYRYTFMVVKYRPTWLFHHENKLDGFVYIKFGFRDLRM